MKWMLLILLFPALCFAQEPEMVFPDTEAEFPGGQNELREFILDNANIPLTPKDDDCTVIVSFIVAEDGSITGLGIVRGCTKAADAEAKRLVSIMPNWKPAMVEGEIVKTRCRLPIRFEAPTKQEYRILKKLNKK